jgi:hypothetical protein
VTRAMPPGDSGNRTTAAGRAPRCCGAVSGACGLVVGVAFHRGQECANRPPASSAGIADVMPQLAHVRAEGGAWTCRTTQTQKQKAQHKLAGETGRGGGDE